MNHRDKMINDMRLRGDTVPLIVSSVDITEASVNRVLSKMESIRYRETQILERNTRNSRSNSARVSDMMTTVIGALENQLDACVTDADRVKLVERVGKLTVILGAPIIAPGSGGPPPIVEVPETVTIDEFNESGKSARIGSGPVEETHFPQPTPLSPAGSEMPPPSLKENKEEGVFLVNEPDEELREVWEEIEAGVDELDGWEEEDPVSEDVQWVDGQVEEIIG